MKKCCFCKIEKIEDDFHRDKSTKDGLEYRCKKCKSEIAKSRREKNPEKYREQNRKSLQRNYETIRASQKRHLEKNREKILKRRRELRNLRKEEINKKEQQRRKKDPNFLVKNRERFKKYYRKNKLKMLPKHNAHKLVMFAVKLGILNRPLRCTICQKEGKIEGHHEDYTKPLDVQWVCKGCHKIIHMRRS